MQFKVLELDHYENNADQCIFQPKFILTVTGSCFVLPMTRGVLKEFSIILLTLHFVKKMVVHYFREKNKEHKVFLNAWAENKNYDKRNSGF